MIWSPLVCRAVLSPMFAASPAVGWCAHFEEQRNVGRLIRPASIYVGPMGTAV
jgi:citrate synthase